MLNILALYEISSSMKTFFGSMYEISSSMKTNFGSTCESNLYYIYTMIGAFSYMRYSYHGDFMIPMRSLRIFTLGTFESQAVSDMLVLLQAWWCTQGLRPGQR